MCNAHNHPPNCDCGWGGQGWGSSGGWGGGRGGSLKNSHTFYSNNISSYPVSSWDLKDSFCYPTTCPYCGSPVFFIRHNGGSVWVDELGWPWPKHSCFDDNSIAINNTINIVEDFNCQGLLNSELLGIVILVKEDRFSRKKLTIKCQGEEKERFIAIYSNEKGDNWAGKLVLLDIVNSILYTQNNQIKIVDYGRTSPNLLRFERRPTSYNRDILSRKKFYDKDNFCNIGDLSRTGDFTIIEAQILTDYGCLMQALMDEKILPESEEEKHFIQICSNSYILPETQKEKAWIKYLKVISKPKRYK